MRAARSTPVPSTIEKLEKLERLQRLEKLKKLKKLERLEILEFLEFLGLNYRVLDEKTIILRVTPRELPLLREKFFDNPVFQVEVHFTEEEWENRSEIRLISPVKRWWVMPPTRVYEEMVKNEEFGLIYFPASGKFEIGVSITPPKFRD